MDNPNEAPDQMAWWRYPLEYLILIKRNPRYRTYLVSHICQHVGDWWIRIANLIALDRLAPNDATAIAILTLTKVVPQIFLSSLGGVLADSVDKRKLMIGLDIVGAIITLTVVLAIQKQSLLTFYCLSAMRATVQAFYEPVTKSIVPFLVPDKMELKRAMTINGLAWSVMVLVGGIVAGQSAASFGLEVCYLIDGTTYLISACVLCFLRGNYKVNSSSSGTTLIASDDKENNQHRTVRGTILALFRPVVAFFKMLKAVIGYLYKSGFGMLILMKASGSLLWGPADILNLEYAHVEGDETATEKRLGFLFSSVGLGCVIGPILANFFANPERPSTLQLCITSGYAFMMIGWFGFAQVPGFAGICSFTAVRATGSSIVYINSSLLLQTLSEPQMLGRVLALEFALCMLTEAASATTTGYLFDKGWTKDQLSIGTSVMAGGLFLLWSIFHMFGMGAARFNPQGGEVRGKETKVAKVAKV